MRKVWVAYIIVNSECESPNYVFAHKADMEKFMLALLTKVRKTLQPEYEAYIAAHQYKVR